MHHFDSERHTTDDVVRQAIIPLSAKTQSDMSRVLMRLKSSWWAFKAPKRDENG